MDATTVVPQQSTPQNTVHERLRAHLDDMQGFLDNERSNAYALGKCVNVIEDEGLATACGYPDAQKCFTLQLKGVDEERTRSLMRYARVAKHFTLEQAMQFGITNLDLLIAYELETHNGVLPGDPGEHEVVVVRDGSTFAKKFRDCACSDFRKRSRSAKAANQDTTDAAQTAMVAPVTALASAAKPVEAPKSGGTQSVRSAGPVQLLTLGAVVTFVGEWLHNTIVGSIVVGVGSAICLGAVAMLVRHLVAAHAEWSRVFEGMVKPLAHLTQKLHWLKIRPADPKAENKEPPGQTPRLAA